VLIRAVFHNETGKGESPCVHKIQFRPTRWRID